MSLTSIQWADYTFNPWMGCRKVAPECANCYIVTTPPFRFRGLTHGSVRVRTAESTWKQPHTWNRKGMVCDKCGSSGVHVKGKLATGMCEHCGTTTFRKSRVFCLSLGDWLDDENVPIEWLADLLRLIFLTPNLDWLLLTKRPQNWKSRICAARDYWLDRARQHAGHAEVESEEFGIGEKLDDWICFRKPPSNVWIGVSAGADQAAALTIPARIHFLSCEPMLHPLESTGNFDWIIFGGESGKKARPCDIEWIRDGVNFCRAFKIAPFVKQLGARPELLDSHGGDMSEWPEDLRVREFPTLLRLAALEVMRP